MLILVQPSASSAGKQPSRTYYEVLDISPNEQDPMVIEEAALRCAGHVRTYQLTRETECTLRLNEIAQALHTLLDPDRRREYDLSLRTPGNRDPPTLPQRRRAAPTRDEDTRVFLVVAERTCDVQLFCRRRALRKDRR